MSKHVHAGSTFNIVGTLAAGETLIGLAGHPGAVIGTGKAPTNDGTIILDGSSKPNASGATLRDTGVLTNAGLIGVGGATYSTHAALLDVERVLNNAGAISVAAGSGGAGGRVLIDAFGSLTNSSTLMLAGGATAGASGAMLTNDGVLVNAIGGTIALSSGLQAIAGAAATLSLTGVMQNSGALDIGSYVDAASAGALLVDDGSLTNTGVITVLSSGYVIGAQTVTTSTLKVTGTLVNQGQIILHNGVPGDNFYLGQGGLLLDFGVVENSGTILLMGNYASSRTGGSIAASGVLTNSGTLLVQMAAGITVTGSASNTGSITLYGGGSPAYAHYYPGSGGLLTVDSVMSNSGTITLDGGLYSDVADPSGGLGAKLVDLGSLGNTGVLAVGGGTGSVNGRYVGEVYHGTGATISVLGSMNNTGIIELHGGGVSNEGLYGTGGALIDAGYMSNESGGLIKIEGGPGSAAGTLTILASSRLLDNGRITGSGVLLNQGVLLSNARGSISGVTFTNDGIVENYHGTFTVDSSVAADAGKTGLFLISDDTLDFGSAVAGSQTIQFQAGSHPGTLALGDAKEFGGTLSGLTAGDVIDFLKLDVTSATTAGDVLAIGLSSGTTLDLALAAPLVGVSLDLQRDGNHGVDLVLTASAQGHF